MPALQPYSDSFIARYTARNKLGLALSLPLAGVTVLDVGSGTGSFEVKALEAGATTVCGLDSSLSVLRTASARVAQASYIQASGTSLPVRAEVFDVVVAFDVIEHLPINSERQLCESIYRSLRPGGRLILSTPDSSVISRVLDPAWYFGHRHYSGDLITDILKSAGFDHIQFFRRGGVFELASMFFLYVFKWLFRSEVPFKSWLERQRDVEYLGSKDGFASLFVMAQKPRRVS